MGNLMDEPLVKIAVKLGAIILIIIFLAFLAGLLIGIYGWIVGD